MSHWKNGGQSGYRGGRYRDQEGSLGGNPRYEGRRGDEHRGGWGFSRGRGGAGRGLGGNRDEYAGGRGFESRSDDGYGAGRNFGFRREVEIGEESLDEGERADFRSEEFRGGRRDRHYDAYDGGRGGFNRGRGGGSGYGDRNGHYDAYDGGRGGFNRGRRGSSGYGDRNGRGDDSDDFVASRSFLNSASNSRYRGRDGDRVMVTDRIVRGGRGGWRGRGRGRWDSDREDSVIDDREDSVIEDREDSTVEDRYESAAEEGTGRRRMHSRRPRIQNASGPLHFGSRNAKYQEKIIFGNITKGINFSKYDNIPVKLTGRDPTNPITLYTEAQLHEAVALNITKAGYTHPTPVQKYTIPAVLAARDIMGIAQTGSGKTAAYLLPILSLMLSKGLHHNPCHDPLTVYPAALVIAPTRELAFQIYHEARKFSFLTVIMAGVAYGGMSTNDQLDNFELGCHILVGTPGRLIYYVDRGYVSLNKVKFLVLDEADRMLNMGFLPEVMHLIQSFEMRARRQTLMFSATFPEDVQRLAADFLNDYLFLTVGKVGGAANDIVQVVIPVEALEKREKLTEILRNKPEDKVLVFVETKRQADFLAMYLSQDDFPTTSIHGNRHQSEREEALDAFKTGRTPILVATSVAARGLDIPKVNHVINFDMPTDISDYVHRIGRTGRIGHSGLATSFFDISKDSPIARSLVKVLSDAEQDVPIFLEDIAETAIGTGYGPAGGDYGAVDRREGDRGARNDSGFNPPVPSKPRGGESWD